ncbi:helix-turn-helix transcriptional regulator [Scytonema hofmannii]|nr:hypothetical protein [Scytonema hofmannii]
MDADKFIPWQGRKLYKDYVCRYFGNSAQFWLNLQTQYDLRQALEENVEF